MFRSELISEKILGALFCICLAAAIIPAAICLTQLQQSQMQIREISEVRAQARQAHLLTSQIAQSVYNFTAAALDLTAEERDELFEQTDEQLASLNTTMLVRGQLLVQYLSAEDNSELTNALQSIAETWEDIRERSKDGLTGTEKSFHFLSLHRDASVARHILERLQVKVDREADNAVSSALRLSNEMSFYLLSVIALAAALTILALFGAYWLLRKGVAGNLALRNAVEALYRRDVELNAQNERFSMALNNMSQGLCMYDKEQRLIVCNAQYGALFDLPPELMDRGVSFQEILGHCVRKGYITPDKAGDIIESRMALQSSTSVQRSFFELSDGRVIQGACQSMPHGGWVGTYEDFTERRNAEAKIAHMARHDALTGLPNRTLFHEELERAMERAADGETLAVLFLDLDHFKGVNDTLGHPVGDLLLKAVAGRIKSCLRNIDTVARLGGDEFAIIQGEVEDLNLTTNLAQEIIEVLSAPFDLGGHHIVIGTSVGIALSPMDGSDPDQLLKSADLALYRSKGEGRNTFRFFETEMDAKMQERRALELDLRKALAEKEFEVYYQPLINAQSEEISGFEALLRWKHPQRGFVPPSDFIPLAEEIGLIGRIGAWVLKVACEEASTWPSHLKIAVNLSPMQFKGPSLVLDVIAALGSSGLSAQRLELEITESVMLQDTESTLGILHQLRSLGVKISMDDFGTGYSSLSYLRKFPFDKIKIDQSFVRDLVDKADSMAIVRAVTSLGADLGMSTTAEGVETVEQFERLRLEGCTEMQGYLFSRPKPASEIRSMLNSNRQIAVA